MMPAAAGPTENPRLIAMRFSEKARVMLPCFAYSKTAEEFAGRTMSATAVSTNTPRARDQNSVKKLSIQKSTEPTKSAVV